MSESDLKQNQSKELIARGSSSNSLFSSSMENTFDSIYTNFKKFLTESTYTSEQQENLYFQKNVELDTQKFDPIEIKQESKEDQKNFIEAYIRTISDYIENSQETTLQGLNIAVKRSTEKLLVKIKEDNILPKDRSILSLRACSEILINIINKHFSKKLNFDFETNKKSLVKITQDLRLLSVYAKDKISGFFSWSIKSGMTLLVHGYSSTTAHALINSRKSGINFSVLVTESRPDNSGELMAKVLKENGISTKIILDISIGYFIQDIDAILVGADAVCENGGIINRIGTFTIACCAKRYKKPFYVMVESLKFLKMYPLNQSDVPYPSESFLNEENGLEYKYSLCDFTPPDFISFLFTDIGIFTPSAVSDELIQMFYN